MEGDSVSLHEFAKILRARWIIVAAATLAALLGAVALTLLTTPEYRATTRLFVSATQGTTVQDNFSGNKLSQERVLSYVELIQGETLAARTIERLNLEMSPSALKAKITAKSKPNTVLIDVAVLDPSPVRARDIANAVSDEFVTLARELETPRPGATPSARVVVEQRATIPAKKYKPKWSFNLAVGLIVGATLGTGLAVLRDQLDNTVKSPEALEEISGAGVIGYIPFEKSLQSTPTISFVSSNSGVAEAFRKLRTNLQFLAVDNPPRVIVVTSCSPGEGKSTTATNVALALAEAEHKVVLVDGDLRRPRLAKYLDLIGQVGFSTALSGGAPIDDVLQETKFSNLTVMTSGSVPPNPSELLGSMAAKRILGELRSRFDYVIIDSPPLLAVTDGAVLSAGADGALVVVHAGKTTRDQLSHAVGVLHDIGATVLGTVLSMVPTRGAASYSYYGGHYYGGHYIDEANRKPAVDSAAKHDESASRSVVADQK